MFWSMEQTDPERTASSRRVTFSRENFDDYMCALMVKIHNNDTVDRVISGELCHPLIVFQQVNNQNLM